MMVAALNWQQSRRGVLLSVHWLAVCVADYTTPHAKASAFWRVLVGWAVSSCRDN